MRVAGTILSFSDLDRTGRSGHALETVFFGSSLSWGANASGLQRTSNREIMQFDAACGTLSEIGEFLVQNQRCWLVVLPSIPRRWRCIFFAGQHCPGGFVLGAKVADGRAVRIAIESRRGGNLRLRHQLGAGRAVDGRPSLGGELDRGTTPGQRLLLTRVVATAAHHEYPSPTFPKPHHVRPY
jgi:hypothetical protein